MFSMRTTLTLDDDLDRELRELAHRSGRSFKQTVNETLRRGLAPESPLEKARPYVVPTVSLGATAAGINLDKALQLADELEDAEIIRKLRAGK